MDYKRVLKLRFSENLSFRDIAESTGYGKTTIGEFIQRFNNCEALSYPLSEDVTNEYIEQLLYRKPGLKQNNVLYRSFDEDAVYKALSHKGETLKHLWQKYNGLGTVNGLRPLSYRQYCRRYSEWLEASKITFHIPRQPGINLELDYAGKKLQLQNAHNPSKPTEVTVFVAALSYSDYFYAEGMITCDVANWIRVNNNALDFFGGITQTITPDNCKVAVNKNKDWIDPWLNKDYQEWAEYNDTVITPAKVKSPTWKPTVENHVRLISMHILIEMEGMTFYSLDELNAELRKRVDEANRENFSGLNYSRLDMFNSEEKESLLPLRQEKYEYLVRKTVKVNPDFSFVFDKVHYSMPRKYLKAELEIRAGETKIYVYNMNGDRIRTHERSYTPKSWVVIPSDMPKEYGDYGYWNIPFFLQKASRIGPRTRILIENVIAKFKYPAQSFRSCFGIIRFADRYGADALEKCCDAAILAGKCNYTYVSNTITTFADLKKSSSEAVAAIKQTCQSQPVTGRYKDDDDKYSLSNLISKQKGEV